jgi:hypothetical protein
MQSTLCPPFHIVDPSFPLVPNDGYLPPLLTVDAHLGDVRDLGVTAGAGPKTVAGQTSRNAYERGTRRLLRELAKLLR